jgi:DNA-binding NarL/FixJ family response regulator
MPNPRAQSKLPPVTARADPTLTPTAIRVVLVEDHAPTREIFAEWIAGTPGFELVAQYADGEAALAGLPQEQPNVTLMDINLPGHSGVECVQQLKPRLPRTQFVMLTVYEDSDHIFQALAAGAAGYLLKQTPHDDLIAAIRDVHQGGSPMSSNIARKVVQRFQQTPPAELGAEGLSARESEVLDLLSRGYLYKEIGERLGLSLHTVNHYTRRIYEKLHVHSRAQAVACFTHPPSPANSARSSS